MNTDRLIDMLSTNVEPVRPRQAEQALGWAVAIGAAAALCVMAVTVSWRADLDNATTLGFVTLKVFLALTVVGTGVAALIGLGYPGRELRRPLRFVWFPFAAAGIGSLIVLAMTPSGAWHRMTVGTHWALCLYCIPLFAVIPFAVLIWALRQGAPTNLSRTGAIAGLVAGALGAAAYALHCPDDSIPFIAVWYGVSIAACAFVGAQIGPRLLRW